MRYPATNDGVTLLFDEMEDAERRGLNLKVEILAEYAERLMAHQDFAQAATEDESDETKIDRLIESGMDEYEARSRVTGRSVESIRRDDHKLFLSATYCRKGSFRELVALEHAELVESEYLRAWEDTNGHMIKAKYEDRSIEPRDFWGWPQSRIVKYASPEMLEWFNINGRLTLTQRIHSIEYGGSDRVFEGMYR